MTAYADIQTRKDQLIRKALEGSAFIAPYTADPITSLTEATGTSPVVIDLAALPTGYVDAGWITTDGFALSEAVSATDIQAWGTPDPVRSDVTQRTTTVKVTFMETNATTIGLYTGQDMTSVTADHNTGELGLAQPEIPEMVYYRLLCLGVDNSDTGEIYVARFLPRVKVTDYDDQAFANGNDPIQYGLTFTAYPDSVLGYSSKYLFGGPGWEPMLSDMGIAQAAS